MLSETLLVNTTKQPDDGHIVGMFCKSTLWIMNNNIVDYKQKQSIWAYTCGHSEQRLWYIIDM